MLGVFVTGGVVAGDGCGDGRERNARGGRISASGIAHRHVGGGAVVHAHKPNRNNAGAIRFAIHIDGNLLDDGVALLTDDLDTVDVLRDDLHVAACRVALGRPIAHVAGETVDALAGVDQARMLDRDDDGSYGERYRAGDEDTGAGRHAAARL
ncbi:hypothetical protein BCEP4_2360004 [Burkholderia cepacia]|nr:hypothetical protein BCEP4_2360004 [Burkholderia cepacia]